MHFSSRLAALIALLPTLFFAGCIQVEKTIKLKADGSGTIEEKVVMGAQMVAQMKAMAAFGGQPDGKPAKAPEMFDEVKLKAEAAKMGDGVTYVSGKKITAADGGEGFTAIYAFKDINNVKLSASPSDIASQGGDMKVTSKGNEDPLTFKYAKGELLVNTPVPKAGATAKKDDKPTPDEAMQEAMMPMMQQMFKDMKMALFIEVPGKITESNAQFKEASRVTVMDVDFNKVMADPVKFKAMTKIKDPNSAEAKALLKDIPGVKVETNNPLKVRFQ